ncbi:hypothetical protein SAMN04487948_101126 [Halogranum amylolyticum]|uniref:Uncharacterized protein n=1 Tax=Halogranum amylolyticum TaxID=660520 RepID=A0A1H8MVW5_9EURY|nr:hypothetical protein [Halogranum amylolyticum]SEO21414.1 hypothetical protein SAMN04487948_101126 [Halogranum amylolyticum]
MRQSWFRYLGLLDLLLVAGFVALFGPASLASSIVMPAMLLAGLSALLAGSVAHIALGPVTVSWRYLVGVTYALFALVLPASYLPSVLAGTAAAAEWLLFVVGTVGGLTLLFYGVDVVREGGNFEIETDVERTIG